MSMNEFRRLAAKIDQHMQQFAAQGVSEAHAIINREIKKTFMFSIHFWRRRRAATADSAGLRLAGAATVITDFGKQTLAG
jgi:hypothetical protein